MAIIQTYGLAKRYGGIVAVDDVSFQLRPGKVTALLGPNGAGKSTTLRLMLDLERGDGETLFDGRPYRHLARPMAEVGACVGPAVAHPGRRVRAHLRMLAAAGRIPARRVDEVLDLVGLAPVAGARVRVLSTGALGRLALAAALLGDPDTLILDEPATGLDPQGLRWLRDFLRAYAAEGRTVLVAGHILAETARCADRVMVMSRGRIVVEESGADFLRRGVRDGVSVRTPQVARLTELLRAEGFQAGRSGGTTMTVTGTDRARVGEIAFRGGILLHELAEREPGLGDAFTDVITCRRENAQAAIEDLGLEPRRVEPKSAKPEPTGSEPSGEHDHDHTIVLTPITSTSTPARTATASAVPPETRTRPDTAAERSPDTTTTETVELESRPASVPTAERAGRPEPAHATPTRSAEPEPDTDRDTVRDRDTARDGEILAPLPPRGRFARTWRAGDHTEQTEQTDHTAQTRHTEPATQTDEVRSA